MARLLRQSTAFTFRIGPFLDSTDGVTAETSLTIAQADIQISKAGGAFAQTSASPTTTHDTDGWYQCPLTTTDTNTLGHLTVQITVAGALPVWEHFTVVPAMVYDSLVAGSDTLDVQVTGMGANVVTATAIADSAITAAKVASAALTSAKFGSGAITSTVLADGAITAPKLATDSITAATIATDAVTEIQSGLATAAALATVDGIVDDILVDTGTTIPATLTAMQGATFDGATDSLEAIRNRGDAAWTTGAGGSNPLVLQNTTIATLASQTSFTLTAGSADNDAYNGAIVVFTDQSTTTQKAVGVITDYVGSTRTVTLLAAPAFTIATGDTVDVITGTNALAVNGAAPQTAADIRAEIDSNSTQLAAIVEDTGTTIPAQLTTIDGVVDGIAVQTSRVDALIEDSAGDRFTSKALEQAPSGTGASAASIRAEIDANSTQLAAIRADTEDLQAQIGVDGAGLTAIGDTRLANLDATVSSRASAAALATVDNEVAAIQATADAIEADTQNIQSRIPAALNNGVMPADVQRINNVEIVGDGSGTPFNV